MNEILDLIRLLAERPLEEDPLRTPATLLQRVRDERVVREGVAPQGAATPPMPVTPWKDVEPGTPAGVGQATPFEGPSAGLKSLTMSSAPPAGIRALQPAGAEFTPINYREQSAVLGMEALTRPPLPSEGAPAAPRSARAAPSQLPAVIAARPGFAGTSASLTSPQSFPGTPASERSLGVTVTPAAIPRGSFLGSVGDTAKALTPEFTYGAEMTPTLLRQYQSAPAHTRQVDSVVSARAHARQSVSVVIPGAFPYDPSKMFSAADRQTFEQAPPVSRQFSFLPSANDQPRSSEQTVADGYQRTINPYAARDYR
jgi:hypothetical protein